MLYFEVVAVALERVVAWLDYVLSQGGAPRLFATSGFHMSTEP